MEKKVYCPMLAYQSIKNEKNEAIKKVINKLNGDYNLLVEDAIGDEDINTMDIVKYILDETECPNNKDIQMYVFLHEIKGDYAFAEDDERSFDALFEQNYDTIDDFYGMEIVRNLDYNELWDFVKSKWDDEEEVPSLYVDVTKMICN